MNDAYVCAMFMSAAGNMRGPQNLRIGNKEFERISEFKYLGNIIQKKTKMTNA
jgi:hypothetical protein